MEEFFDRFAGAVMFWLDVSFYIRSKSKSLLLAQDTNPSILPPLFLFL